MPPPVDGMTAYRTRDGEGGVQLALRGESGKRAFEAIEADLSNIATALGQKPHLIATSAAPFSGNFSVLFAGNANDDVLFRPWLARQVNALVNTLRPLLSSLSEAEPL